MIPGLQMYLIECKACGETTPSPEFDSGLQGALSKFMRKVGDSKICQCPSCGAKAKKTYMGPAR